MAHMTQELKKQLEPEIKAVLNRYGVKGTIRVVDNCVLAVTLQSGPLNLKSDYSQIYAKYYTGETAKFCEELESAMNGTGALKNHDYGNTMVDYQNVGWYTTIHAGSLDKPYTITK